MVEATSYTVLMLCKLRIWMEGGFTKHNTYLSVNPYNRCIIINGVKTGNIPKAIILNAAQRARKNRQNNLPLKNK